MSIEDALLRRIDDEQVTLAKEALVHPQQRDAFEYGRMTGMYAGLEVARGILVDMIADRDDHERSI